MDNSLIQKLKNLPAKPGVYQFFDKDERLLYVGKAKVLKNRVKSYFRFTPKLHPSKELGPRIFKMVGEVYSLDYIVVSSEEDALILENSLIKQLKPKYNILLRDDKTYPYIYIDHNQTYPRIDITRKVVGTKNIRYFGPFPSGARDIIDTLYENFQLVQKANCLKGKKACLFYQMKKCLAPCEGKITPKQYQKIVDRALTMVQKPNRLIDLLEKKMAQLAADERFEEAITLRDRIQKLQSISIHSQIDMAQLVNYDIFAIEVAQQKGVVVKLFVRDGKIVSSTYHYFNHTQNYDPNQVYRQALIEYYSKDLITFSSEILLAHEIDLDGLQSFFHTKFDKKIKILHPQRGQKRRLTDIAYKNAKELLKNDQKAQNKTLQMLQKLFDLDHIPYQIECFDNSHLSGSATVGAMIVYDTDGFNKSAYKRYHLHTKDEYSQMQEMLERRITAFDKLSPPDLWVLDGGTALVRLAKTLLQKAGVNLDVVGIAKQKVDAKARRAKGSAKDIIYTADTKIELQPTDTRLHLLQRLRDEAHRFAIAFHKSKKLKDDKQISLLQISGIGPAKSKRLLDYFGSFEKIQQASIKSLMAVVSSSDAQKIHNFYKNDNK